MKTNYSFAQELVLLETFLYFQQFLACLSKYTNWMQFIDLDSPCQAQSTIGYNPFYLVHYHIQQYENHRFHHFS